MTSLRALEGGNLKEVSTARMKRPTVVTLLSGAVLIFAVTHLVQFGSAIANWQELSLLLPFSPLYLTATGLGWGLAGLAVSISLWFGLRFARIMTIGLIVSYSVYYWLDRLLIARSDLFQINLPFALGLNIVILLVSLWLLNLSKVRSFLENGGMQV